MQVEVLQDFDVESANATLDKQRHALFQRLLSGASGAEVVAAYTQFVDGLIIGRYRNALRKLAETVQPAGIQHCCLIALGGYGRRELAPYSDIDVMFLFRGDAGPAVESLSRDVLHHLWDLGFQVGHSVRTVQDCVHLGLSDVTTRTSLMEARYLAGSADLFQEFERRYASRVVARRPDQFVVAKIDERQREYDKFGDTVYLLEPNVKKSQGGLRDLHLMQWIGMAKHQAPTIQDLADRAILSRPDYLALMEAREFLWRVRALLHFRAGMAQEILSFDEQVELAKVSELQDRPNLLAVEQFMQQYYRHTRRIHETCTRFIDRSRSLPLMARFVRWLPASRVDRHFVRSGNELQVSADTMHAVVQSPDLVLRLFDVAQARGLKIETSLLEEIQQHVGSIPDEAFRTPEASRAFLTILSRSGSVAKTLDAMHRAHLLEKIIPAFGRVRGLMQFNQYHKYTVDEHSLLAVSKAESFLNDPGVLGEVYREIHRKDLLHLAVLLHDLGKGREDDHSEIGKSIAEKTAARLGLDEQGTRTLIFLVHRHLMMAHTAFRRDPYDDKVLLGFARAVGTPEVLRKLLVLTAADLAAVGPGVLTKWKESLLVELYLKAMPEVSGERETTSAADGLRRVAHEVAHEPCLRQLAGADEDWIEAQLAQFPMRYAHGTAPSRVAAHLAAIKRLQPGEVLVETDFSEALGTCEYSVITFDGLTPGLFSKIAGVMAAKGLQILDAQILTRHDDVVVDTFQVTDLDHRGQPPAERMSSIARTIVRILKGEDAVEGLLERSRRLTLERQIPTHRQPTDVQVDNETSDRFTILDVFADDRQGLLYVITRAIFDLGLSVHGARISTRLDQVVDVFYVTDLEGGKIEDAGRLEQIRGSIQKEIDRGLKNSGSG